MRWLPFALSFAVALALTPAALRAMAGAGQLRESFRGLRLVFPAGAVLLGAALIALAPLALAAELADWNVLHPSLGAAVAYVLGVAFLGLLDDLVGRSGAPGSPRGWRGHLAAARRGELSTGLLKAAGALGLAALILSEAGGTGQYLVSVALLVLSTNLFNLLDTRPGRSAKAFVLLAAGLSLGAWTLEPLETLGLFCGPLLVVGFHDLRERAMLGDTGSNAIGALAGLWLIAALPLAGEAIALSVVLALTVYGEFRSLGAAVERVPLVKHLDSWGRR